MQAMRLYTEMSGRFLILMKVAASVSTEPLSRYKPPPEIGPPPKGPLFTHHL